MAGVKIHTCERVNEMGDPLPPKIVTCGIKGHSWCERCDPGPAALCPICHGRGYTTAPVPPRQVRAEYRRFYGGR